MQRLFITALACLLSVSITAQEQVITYPYNPDADTDSLIAVPDMLDLLVLFGNEFIPEPVMVDGVVITEWLESASNICCDSLSSVIDVIQNDLDSSTNLENYSTSIDYVGDMDYWDCVMNCKNLSPTSAVLDYMNVGEHKSELMSIYDLPLTDYQYIDNYIFINHELGPHAAGGSNSVYSPRISEDNGGISVIMNHLYQHSRCVCQTPN